MTEAETTGTDTPDADFTAPETGGEAVEKDAPNYTPASADEREIVLRNADTYLYEMNRKAESDTPRNLRSELNYRAKDFVNQATKRRVFPGAADERLRREEEGPRSLFRQSLRERVEQRKEIMLQGVDTRHVAGPLLDAFSTATNQEKWEAFMKDRLDAAEKGAQPSRSEQQRTNRVLVFRKAYELRQNTLELLAEQETATPERKAEIDEALNQSYWQLMTIAHSQSFTFEKETKIEKSHKGDITFDELAKKIGRKEALRNFKGKETRWDKESVTGFKVNTNPDAAFGPDRDPALSETDQGPRHREWVERRIAGEASGELGFQRGFEKAFVTKGELSPGNLEETEALGESLARTIDFFASRTPQEKAELKNLYGIEFEIEDVSKLPPIQIAGQKGKGSVIEPIPTRTLRVNYDDGTAAILKVELAGFIDVKGGKVTVNDKPTSLTQRKHMKISLHTSHRRSNTEQTKYFKELRGPTIDQLNSSREFQRFADSVKVAEQPLIFSDAGAATHEGQSTLAALDGKRGLYQMEIGDIDRRVDAYHDSLKHEPRWQTLSDIEKRAALERIPSNLKREIDLRNGAIDATSKNIEKLSKYLTQLAEAQNAGDNNKIRRTTEVINRFVKHINHPEEEEV